MTLAGVRSRPLGGQGVRAAVKPDDRAASDRGRYSSVAEADRCQVGCRRNAMLRVEQRENIGGQLRWHRVTMRPSERCVIPDAPGWGSVPSIGRCG